MAIEGTCIWFGPEIPWGYIGHGIFTNNSYEFQIYVHYKHIEREGQRNVKFRELKSGDIVDFDEGEGHRNNGTQAINVVVKKYVEDLC